MVGIMSYRKSIKGDDNVQSEQLSHNRIVVEGGTAVTLLAVFLCVLIVASIILMAVVQMALLQALIIASFVGFFLAVWIVAVMLIRRQISATKTAIAVDEHSRSRALLESNILHATENYILYRDSDGSYQFRGSTVITEHRQFLPHQISAPNHQETILELFDKGMSGRGIEKLLKEKKVSYREITKTLDLYRPDWNRKGTVDSDLIDLE